MAETEVYSSSCREEVEEFDGDFKEYMERELQWSRLKSSGKPEDDASADLLFPDFHWEGIRWVFWSSQDDNLAEFNPNAPAISEVKCKIRRAFEKLILYPELNESLLQFWAPTTTLEGQTLLTTQNQPFALGKTYQGTDKLGLCEYRIISKQYKFRVDTKSGEEELGLPGRVFLYEIHESTPNVEYYSAKEYPQRHRALNCPIKATWAVPLFESSSQTCVGVLELVSSSENIAFWYRKSFLGNLYHVFQEQGLQCFDLYKHYEMRKQCENEDLKTAFTKIRMLMTVVCENHNLPLAFAWVPCGDCNDLLRAHSVGYCENEPFFGNFIFVSHAHHLRKAQGVVGWSLSSPNLSYCSDVTQFNIAEYPLVPYARQCGLSACFAICLQSSCTGNDMFVLEFFLPSSSKDGDDLWTSLSKILGTIKKLFKNFRLASGQELGEELSVEAIEFPNGQKLRSVQSIPAGVSLPCLEPLQNGEGTMQPLSLDQPSRRAINNGMTVPSTEGNDNSSFLPVLEGLQNEVVTMQLDSLDQPSMEAINSEMNIVNTEQNYVHVSSSEEEGTIKTQERDHKSTGVKIDISLEDILRCSNMTRDNAASELRVSISTLRRACRDYGIPQWPPHNTKSLHPTRPLLVVQESIPQLSSDPPSNLTSVSVAHIRPHDPAFQLANMVTIRAKYINDITLKFRLSTSSGIAELQQQVAKRLNLEAGTYNIRYEDEDGEVILLACDEDLQACIHTSKSLGKTSVVVLLEPK